MNDPSMLVSRVADLERQIAMYEKLFQTFSAKLDHHFKKYDLVINTQQQQIQALNDVISTLLNDQYRYSGILRDKLAGTLDGITTTTASLQESNGDSNSLPRVVPDKGFMQGQEGAMLEPGSVPSTSESLNYGSSVNVMLGDIISPESLTTTPNHPNLPSLPVKRSFPNANIDYSPKRINIAETPSDQKLHAEQGHQNIAYASFKSSTEFSSLDNDVPEKIEQGVPAMRVGDVDHTFPPDARRTNVDNSTGSRIPRHTEDGESPSKDEEIDPNVKEELYYTCGGQRKKRKVFVGEFRFLSSPQSVMEIWKEYTEGFAGQPSLKDMELTYQTSWRREPGVSKKFFRRKVLCKAIEKGLSRGYSLQEVVDILEKYRSTDAGKGLQQPIGWLCRHSNVPDVFK